jgi:DNA-binding GntR family transcriptional regulator
MRNPELTVILMFLDFVHHEHGPLATRIHAKQLADYLRGELTSGRWKGKMPGVIRLTSELGVSRDSVEAALVDLEQQGLLVAQGRGKRRTIAAADMGAKTRALRVVVLLFEDGDRSTHYIVELMHALRNAGHHAEYAPKTQTELGANIARTVHMIENTPANAWVVFGGSRDLLE